jgi:hypothetical protein
MYLAVGGVFLWMLRQRSPQTFDNMERDIEVIEKRFSTPEID